MDGVVVGSVLEPTGALGLQKEKGCAECSVGGTFSESLLSYLFSLDAA